MRAGHVHMVSEYGVLFRTVRVVAGVDVDLAETVTFGPVALLSHVSGLRLWSRG